MDLTGGWQIWLGAASDMIVLSMDCLECGAGCVYRIVKSTVPNSLTVALA